MTRALTTHAAISRRAVFGILAAVAAIVGLAAGFLVASGVLPGASARDAGPLLAMTLPDAGGKPQPMAQWKGKVIVVNFWATWCAPCREEMPEFVRAQSELGGKGLQFVGIAADSADKVTQFAEEIHLNYPALIGGFGSIELSRTLGNSVMALPFTVVIDRGGHVVHTQLGPLREARLRAIVAPLL